MYVKRDLEKEIRKNLATKEIIAVVGPRQCGKTTMIKEILKDFSGVNSITFDDQKTQRLFEDDIDSFIELHVKNYKYLFIDEVQYSKESGRQLKYIYDTQDSKIIVSGSSAAELSIQSLKYLVGRIFIFKLYPFNFREYLSYTEPTLLSLFNKRKYGQEISDRIMKHIHHFVIYGGYPRLVLSTSKEEKKRVLKNIYNTFLLKEIRELLELSENDKLIRLMKALSLQIGSLVNYSELSQVTGFPYTHLKKYLQVLEETYIIKMCTAFHTNPRTELVKTPKVYFVDHGFRNICIDNFKTERTDMGVLFENFVFSERMKKGIDLQYWRTKSGAEVDFVYESVPYEIKSMAKTSKSFYSFISKYKPKEAFIVSTQQRKSERKNGTRILFKSFGEVV